MVMATDVAMAVTDTDIEATVAMDTAAMVATDMATEAMEAMDTEAMVAMAAMDVVMATATATDTTVKLCRS